MVGLPLLRVADRALAARSDVDLLATVIAGDRPDPTALSVAARVAAVPLWQRRAWGAEGLVRELAVGPGRALRLAALWELAERWYPDDRPSIASPREAVLLLGALRNAPREEVWVVLLDARHRALRCETIAVGGINSSRLSPRDVLAPALRTGAVAVVVAHNHPSGDPSPSRADRLVTTALREAAGIVGIPLLDHLIVTARSHHSFREADGWDVEAV